MKKFKLIVIACLVVCALALIVGCTSSSSSSAASASGSASAASASSSASAASESASAASASASAAAASTSAASSATLANGTYKAKFNTDSSMFKANEAYEGKGVLTVKDGQMTIHVTLASTKIVNLYPGLAEDAQKDGAVLLQPTVEEVKYSDGTTDKANAFDIPVPAIDEEFDCALIGEKGKWYDHKVSVSDVEPE